MSTNVVRAEIERFLRSSSPEVLCISGRWGVGKTYSWQLIERGAEASDQLAMRRYAYVSLFGLTSLGEVRSAIVENTVVTQQSIASPDASSLYDMLRRGKQFARRNRPALEVAAGFFRMKDAGDALYRAAFLTVKEQLICFDDLERAGKTLEMRDILGLASMLREQRNCKVVLLLNKEQVVSEQVDEFDRQLEKVVDIFLTFEPTSAEAAAIAITGDDAVGSALRDNLIALNVTNMRVMKKIERWARLIEVELKGSEPATLVQATKTVVLAGYCFLQRDLAPSLDFMRAFNAMSGLFGREEEAAKSKQWRELLGNYSYGSTDKLDEVILAGVEAGYFRADFLRAAAHSVEKQRAREKRDDSYSKAWRLYHDSLKVEDSEILDAIYAGAIENLTGISSMSMNSGVRFLRRYGRDEQASNLVGRYVEANGEAPEFFGHGNQFFGEDPIDPELLAAMETGRMAIVDGRDPAEMLQNIARTGGFNPGEDSALLSRLTVDELVELFDEHAADNCRGMMKAADLLANQPGSNAIRASLTDAFMQIAARSPMRADRLHGWGVLPPRPISLDAQAGEA